MHAFTHEPYLDVTQLAGDNAQRTRRSTGPVAESWKDYCDVTVTRETRLPFAKQDSQGGHSSVWYPHQYRVLSFTPPSSLPEYELDRALGAVIENKMRCVCRESSSDFSVFSNQRGQEDWTGAGCCIRGLSQKLVYWFFIYMSIGLTWNYKWSPSKYDPWEVTQWFQRFFHWS